MKSIKININNEEGKKLSFTDVSQNIQNKNMYWRLYFLYVVGHVPGEESVEKFENEITSCKHGFRFNWQELCFILDGVDQIIDLLVIGCVDEGVLDRCTKNNIDPECDCVIEMVDSTYWLIETKEDNNL